MATMTVKETALEIGTDPRTLRKFLRSSDSGIDAVGKGSRYSIERRALKGLTKRFNAWNDARTAPEVDAPADAD